MRRPRPGIARSVVPRGIVRRPSSSLRPAMRAPSTAGFHAFCACRRLCEAPLGAKLDTALEILNGVVGDHLVRTRNALATELACIHLGAPLAMKRAVLARALPSATPRVAILVHGLMTTESIWKLPD